MLIATNTKLLIIKSNWKMKLIVYLINFEGKSRTPTGEATGYLLAGTQYNTSHKGEVVYCDTFI